jgi:hypothetical protein
MTTPLTGAVGTLPLPNTAVVPIPGELVQAVHVQVPVQALLDQDATLEALKLSLAGGTMTGALTLAGIPGAIVLPNGGTFIARDGALATTIALNAGLGNIAVGAAGVPSIVLDGLTGSIGMIGSIPAPTADPGADNIIRPGALLLAHGKVDFNAGVVTINGGYNFASASISISVQANIVFVRAMADAHYTVLLGCARDGGPGFIEYPLLTSQSTTGFSCNIRDLAAAAAPINLTTQHPGHLYFAVIGSQ